VDLWKPWRRKAAAAAPARTDAESLSRDQQKVSSPGNQGPAREKSACHCCACGFTWLEAGDDAASPPETVNGLQCSACHRIFCRRCLGALDLRLGACPCKHGTLHDVATPNGRPAGYGSDPDAGEVPFVPADDSRDPDLHLYFGYEGEVPIAIDPGLAVNSSGSAADQLRWAEALLDSGLYYHADRELASIPEPQPARAMWLRARLLIVRLTNGREYVRRRIGGHLRDPGWNSTSRISDLLHAAVVQDPALGEAWLTSAAFDLAENRTADGRSRALVCAERADALLEGKRGSRLLLGKALAANERFEGALAAFSSIPPDSSEAPEAAREAELAEIQSQARKDPPDPSACWRLGKSMIADHRIEPATQLFQRVADKLPGRPEGYCGLGRLALMDSGPSPQQRVERAYDFVSKALSVGADFGPAHELMGIVLRNAKSSGVELPGSGLQSEYFQRAVELDSSSDFALAALADEAIDRGECDVAFDLLKKAAALDTRLDGVYFKLAVFYQAKRDPVKQAEAYRRAKDLAPGLDLAADYKNKILDMCGFRY